jgi:tRNA(fMet)-specific endonuclease VapC
VYVLDTDTVSNFLDARRQNPMLRTQILGHRPEHLWISVVTVEELLRGALNRVRDAQTGRRSPAGAHQLLIGLLNDLGRFRILPYTADAERIYQSMPSDVRRRGPNDCRIAASARAVGYAVVTANASHFAAIPGLNVEDWTR